MQGFQDAMVHLIGNEAIVFPAHVMTLAANGGSALYRYSERQDGKGIDCTILAEYEEPPGYQLPVHALLMDKTGYTARVIVRQRKAPPS